MVTRIEIPCQNENNCAENDSEEDTRMQTGDESLGKQAGVEGLPQVFENETEKISQSQDENDLKYEDNMEVVNQDENVEDVEIPSQVENGVEPCKRYFRTMLRC